MAYLHIPNLYKDPTILLCKQCYALEKIHGTSAHISWDLSRFQEVLQFYAGGEKRERFVQIFDEDAVQDAFCRLEHERVVVFGEAYGGKQQKQAWRYGPDLRFVVFEVQVGDTWLSVPNAADVAAKLGLEFVHYEQTSTDLEALDAQRDAPSNQAKRNGVAGDQPREGVVLHPLVELVKSNGERVIAKHKRDAERETRKPRVVGADLEVLTKANDIALEWVTETRLQHVLDKLPRGLGMDGTRDVIGAMLEDVLREGAGEFVDNKPARKAISARTVTLFKAHLRRQLEE